MNKDTPKALDALRDFEAELEEADSGPPLIGRWHHGDGVLVSGGIRIARWDCDTNPPTDFRDRVLDWMCDTLNAALSTSTQQAAKSAAVSDLEKLCRFRLSSKPGLTYQDDNGPFVRYDDVRKVLSATANAAASALPRFPNVWCSQCGQDFGPGNEGFSHCSDHEKAKKGRSDLTDERITEIAEAEHAAGRLSWSGFKKDASGAYSIPVIEGIHCNLVRAVVSALAAKSAAPAAVTTPFAYWVYMPDEQRGEFFHTLDEATDDLTNSRCEVTELFDRPATQAPAAVGLTNERISEVAEAEHAAGRLAWSGFKKDASGAYSLPLIEDIHCNLVRAVVAALFVPMPAGAAVGEWQPIETAPKDGSTIRLAYIKDGEFEQTAEMQWSHIQRNGLFPGAVGMWVCPGANFTWNPEPAEFGPTHWQPIAATTPTTGGEQ